MRVRSAAAKATEAADALLAWLHAQPETATDSGRTSEEDGRPEAGGTIGTSDARGDAGPESPPVFAGGMASEDAGTAPELRGRDEAELIARLGSDAGAAVAGSAHPPGRGGAEIRAAPLRPAHTDWLHHRLTVSGPSEPVAAFRAAAAGAGIIPWHYDLDRMEEDWFHLLVSPPPPQRRTLSFAGARLLAGQLREAVARRHEVAVARVGRSRACPLDLHALLPVPERILRLGPDHADALAWLWEHWGTTQALLRVTETVTLAREKRHSRPTPDDTGQAPAGEGVPDAGAEQAAFHLTFWSADWTPWRALATLAERWPALRFDTRPSYERP